MGLVLVVYVIRNTYSAWQAFSNKMPLWFETVLVRRAYQSPEQISKSRSAGQTSWGWRPDILIMHFSLFYLNSCELVWCGESLVLLGALWMPCWRISSSCFTQFECLDTATWNKHEGAGCTVTFNSNFLSPSELKQEHRYALQGERRTGRNALKYLLLLGCLTVHHFLVLG